MDTASVVVGVLGASGGLGTSVLTAALAVRAGVAGLSAVAVDGVRLGGGLDVALGLEQEEGLRWRDLSGVRGAVAGRELLDRLPGHGRVRVLSFDRARETDLPTSAVQGVLTGLRAACRLVVIDLPAPDSPLFRCLREECTDVVLLVGTSPQALAAATVVASHARQGGGRRPRLCVRATERSTELAEAVAAAVDLPLAVVLGHERRLDTHLWRGRLPGSGQGGPLCDAADALLALVASDAAREAA